MDILVYLEIHSLFNQKTKYGSCRIMFFLWTVVIIYQRNLKWTAYEYFISYWLNRSVCNIREKSLHQTYSSTNKLWPAGLRVTAASWARARPPRRVSRWRDTTRLSTACSSLRSWGSSYLPLSVSIITKFTDWLTGPFFWNVRLRYYVGTEDVRSNLVFFSFGKSVTVTVYDLTQI